MFSLKARTYRNNFVGGEKREILVFSVSILVSSDDQMLISKWSKSSFIFWESDFAN